MFNPLKTGFLYVFQSDRHLLGMFCLCLAIVLRFSPLFFLFFFAESDEIILPNALVPPLSHSRGKNQPDLANALRVVSTLDARESKEERGAISERRPLAGQS
jgi:hypothetical protein